MSEDALLEQGLDHVLSTACRRPFETPGGFFVRCGSRLKNVCAGCSAIHVGDWQAIIRSGIFEAGPEHRFYLLTLTAPSFGAVHHVPRPGRPARGCACGERHSDGADGHLRGIPVDPEAYGYADQVDWNATSGRLWDATRARLRALAPSIEFASVREWQARGALHLHVLLRVHVSDLISFSATATEAIALRVTARSDGGSTVLWGGNVDCRPVRADKATGRAILYLTKAVGYLTKDVADGGGQSSKVGRQHWNRLNRAADEYRCRSCPRPPEGRDTSLSHCGGQLHRQWGARSHVVSVSRRSRDQSRPGWSLTGLTRAVQREQRRTWALANLDRCAEQALLDSVRRADLARQAQVMRDVAARQQRLATKSLVSVTASAGPPGHAD